MKKIINRILSKKRNRVILTLLLLMILGIGGYTIYQINNNLALVNEPEEFEPYYPPYPAINTQTKNIEQIKRGEYIAKAGDCIACHTNTPKKGPAFAGGLAMPTPFGTIYAPNITPDKETGIGNWTTEEFITAMRHGVSPKGYYYYPAFPYLYFSRISTEDLVALKAYLDNIPPIKQENRPNEMVFPFSQRLLQLGWRMMFFHPAPPIEAEKSTTELKRGEYLVEGLGHCAMCHSPSYHIISPTLSLGAPMRQYDLTGTKIQGYLAPNISKSNLGNVPVEEIIEVFTKDKMIGGGKIEGPMLEVNHNSLRHLTIQDLKSIAVYLKSVDTKTPPKPKGDVGKVTYESYCSGCHSSGAGGSPKFGDPNSWTPVLKQDVNTIYTNAIKGIRGMPAKGTCMSCSEDDIKKAVDFMLIPVKDKTANQAPPKPKALTMQDGQRIYQQNCSTCHAAGKNNAPIPGDYAAWKPIVETGFVDAYLNVVTGQHGHPARGSCIKCTDAELIAAIKYMMQSSSKEKNFSLW